MTTGKNEKFNLSKEVLEGIGQTGKGALSFFFGGMFVSSGMWNVGIGAKNSITSIVSRSVARFITNYVPNYLMDNSF